MERKRFKVLDVFVDVLNMDMVIQRISTWIDQRAKAYICVAPVSTIVAAQEDAQYANVLNEADMVTPDGMPLVWVGRVKGHEDLRRVCGPDLMRKICMDPCLAHWRHFFFGVTSETLQRLEDRLRMLNPDITICGSFAPPFRDQAQREDAQIIQRINEARPDILWVGIGSPKQEFWLAMNRDQLNVPVMIGIGAAFDFLARIKLRAPKWMQKIGMEWLFRLLCEPRRMWRRYIVGNTKFCFEMLKEMVGLRKKDGD